MLISNNTKPYTMNKFIIVTVLLIAFVLFGGTAAFAAKGGVPGKPSPDNGSRSAPPPVQPYARAPIAQPFV